MIRLLVAGLLLLAGCGGTTYVDSTPPEQQEAYALGWAKVTPKRVTIPRTQAVTSDDVRTADPERPILVNVWASYCGPCEEELPLLESVSESGELQVVGLSRDTSRDDAAKALTKAGVTYENWMDTAASFAVALDGRIPLSAIPASALIVDGRVVAVHIGEFKNRAEVLAGLELG